MLLVKQSASKVVPFFMVDSSDHISPKTGLSPSVQISKAGGTFAAAGGTVAEIGNGWYKITLSTTDTNTLGSLAFYITATGADPVSFSIQVVAFDPESSTDLGLSRIDVDISSRAPASTALSNATWTDTRAVKLDNLDATISSRSTLTASDVWNYTTRTLTSFGTLVSDIWDYSTRTLTSFGTLVSDIWDHSTRTLTAFSTSLAVAVWDVLESAISTANSIGVKVKTNLDATVSSRSTLTAGQAADAVWDEPLADHLTTGSTGAALNAAGSSGDPWATQLPGSYGSGTAGYILGNRLDVAVSTRSTLTASQAADAVWDEPIADHLSSGSTGAALNAAGSSGDPWATPLPGSYGAGTAGNILGNRLDVAVSTRASGADYTAARAAKLDNLDVTVSSRAPASTALSNATWTDTRAAKLDNLDATVSSRSTLTASQVWSHTTRTLTSFGSLVSDIWGYTTSIGVSAVTVLERAYRTLVNKMKVDKSTGSVTLYADNNTNVAATGTVTESDTEVTRSKLTWQ
jgi:hypothetical protein